MNDSLITVYLSKHIGIGVTFMERTLTIAFMFISLQICFKRYDKLFEYYNFWDEGIDVTNTKITILLLKQIGLCISYESYILYIIIPIVELQICFKECKRLFMFDNYWIEDK